MRVLVVDDEPVARQSLRRCLAGFSALEIYEAGSLAAARNALISYAPDVVLIDLCLDAFDRDNRDGFILLREVREQSTAVAIVVTAASEMTEIRQAIRGGAHTYILKDELCEELVVPVLSDLRTRRSLEQEVLGLHGLVGSSAAMETLRRNIRRVAAADAPALILGPTGSGKELVARAIHALSRRAAKPLVAVNCSSFMESLAEAQLFGHEKGYFTGAEKARIGFFGEVDAGTLFFDEIAELALPLQAKLLRVLEGRAYRMLGAAEDSHFAGRVLAATHIDLEERRQQGRFRDDLYYRLDVLTVRVPPLDERKEDIPALAEHFLRAAPRRMSLAGEARDALMHLNWPGNVRELRNLMYRLTTFVEKDVIHAADVYVHKTAERIAGEAVTAPKRECNAVMFDARLQGLIDGLSLRAAKKQNATRLAQNQVRLLEAEGASAEEICRVLKIGRSSLFRLKAGKEDAVGTHSSKA